MLSLQNVKLWIILANGDNYIIKPGQIEHPMIALGEQNIWEAPNSDTHISLCKKEKIDL